MASIFTISSVLTLGFGAIVHRAIFRLLKRLPERPINTMIYPSMVSILAFQLLKNYSTRTYSK
jgi:hypothetical protein